MEGLYAGITADAIDVRAVAERVAAPAFGGEVVFSGVIREHNQGRRVLGVSYDCFRPLAVARIEALLAEAEAKWRPLRAAVIHRTGRLAVGETAVVVAVASVHRDEAFRAARFLIDSVKHQVPLWKREHYEGGDSEWVEGHALCNH